jgi:hypothetical protein
MVLIVCDSYRFSNKRWFFAKGRYQFGSFPKDGISLKLYGILGTSGQALTTAATVQRTKRRSLFTFVDSRVFAENLLAGVTVLTTFTDIKLEVREP